MNERGIASLTAMIILLMLAYSIRGTNFTAGNLVDMTRNFEVENQLQLAAESALNKALFDFNDKTVEEATDALNAYPKNETFNGADAIVVNVMKNADENIIILAVAKRNKYIGGKMNAYRSVAGFLIKTLKTAGEPPEPLDPPEYIYKFKGYLHKTI